MGTLPRSRQDAPLALIAFCLFTSLLLALLVVPFTTAASPATLRPTPEAAAQALATPTAAARRLSGVRLALKPCRSNSRVDTTLLP